MPPKTLLGEKRPSLGRFLKDKATDTRFLTGHLATLRCPPSACTRALQNIGPCTTQTHRPQQSPEKAALGGRKAQTFANFHGVNISTSVHFKLPTA